MFVFFRYESQQQSGISVTRMENPTDEEEGLEGCEDGNCPLQPEVPVLLHNRAHGKLNQDEKRFLLCVERGDVATVRR